MFENRTEKELIVIYVIIALLVALCLTAYNLSPISYFPKDPLLIIIVANVLFFCMFLILYWPLIIKANI